MSETQEQRDRLCDSLRAENKSQREELARKDQEIALLRQKIDLLIKKVFGSSSEKLDLDQLLLFEEGEAKKHPRGILPDGDGLANPEDKEPSLPAQHKRRTRREATLPADLPVEETVLIPDEVKSHPQDYRQVGEEVSVKLDYEPAQFKKLVTRRPKFVRRLRPAGEDETFHIAALPASLKERSLLTPRLAAEISTNRFCNHQPYYRQEHHFLMRHGVHLPRNTMSQWMNDLCQDYLTGTYNAMHRDLLSGDYLQVDETPIDYLKPGHGTTKQGYLWTLSQPELDSADGRGDIFYQWHASRGAKCLQTLLHTPEQCFLGILQSDGYQAYENYRKHNQGIELIACWAHVRRKFYEARDQHPKLSGWLLHQIQNLYGIEARLRESRAGPAERECVRSAQSLPIYQRLGKALWKIKAARTVLPQSSLGKAIDYALGQWSKLELCFRDGRLEIDNNLIENGIRPTKLGAKNWLFMGSERAGQTNAVWFTLIESCRRRRLDPWSYLVWIFEELPKVKVRKETFASYTPKAYAAKLKTEEKKLAKSSAS